MTDPLIYINYLAAFTAGAITALGLQRARRWLQIRMDKEAQQICSQEFADGEYHMDEAYRQAYRDGGWNHDKKERAVLGAGMQDNAEAGVCDILQAFAIHATDEKHFEAVFSITWEQYIDEEFEKNFHVDYKEFNQPCPEIVTRKS